MDSGQNLLTSDVIVRKIRTPGTWTTLSYFISFHVDLLWVPSCLLCSGAYEYPGSLNWDYTNGIGWIRPWTASVAHVSIKMSSTESGYLLHLDTVQLLAQLSFSVLIYFSQPRFWNTVGLVCWRYPLDILTSGGPLPPPFVALSSSVSHGLLLPLKHRCFTLWTSNRESFWILLFYSFSKFSFNI